MSNSPPEPSVPAWLRFFGRHLYRAVPGLFGRIKRASGSKDRFLAWLTPVLASVGATAFAGWIGALFATVGPLIWLKSYWFVLVGVWVICLYCWAFFASMWEDVGPLLAERDRSKPRRITVFTPVIKTTDLAFISEEVIAFRIDVDVDIANPSSSRASLELECIAFPHDGRKPACIKDVECFPGTPHRITVSWVVTVKAHFEGGGVGRTKRPAMIPDCVVIRVSDRMRRDLGVREITAPGTAEI